MLAKWEARGGDATMKMLLHFENVAAPGLSFSVPITTENPHTAVIMKTAARINGEELVRYPYPVDLLNGYFMLEFIEAAAEPVTVPA